VIRPRSVSKPTRYSTVTPKVREVPAMGMAAADAFEVVVVDSQAACLWVDVGSPFSADQMEGD
jgi:hypothetical protein